VRHGDLEPVGGACDGLDDAGAVVVEVGRHELLPAGVGGSRVAGDAAAILAGEHSAPQWRVGEQAHAEVLGGRDDALLGVATQE
jgi:hypothetical protein